MTITNAQYNELLSKIKTLESELSKYKPEPKWYEGSDSLILKVTGGSLELESNYSSWSYIKNELEKQYTDYLSLEVTDGSDKSFVSLNINQMEEVRDYLTQKIDYLNS